MKCFVFIFSISFVFALSFLNPFSRHLCYGIIFIIVSNKPHSIGIDIDIIITLPPISILLAMAFSPESLHTLTANSVSIAIPVIFIRSIKNSLLIDAFADKFLSISIIPDNLANISANIITPAVRETYIANSGLYCFKITIIINAIKPCANYLYNIHYQSFLSFLH